MKLGPFTIGGEEESEEKYTTTGQMRSLVKQVLLAVSPFVAVGIIGVIGIPTYMVFWAQVIFFAVYLLLIAGVYLNIQREAVTYLCFAYLHLWIGALMLPPISVFFKGLEDLDIPGNLKSFFSGAEVLKPQSKKQLEEACTSLETMKGSAHFAGIHLKDPIYAGAFKRIDNIITITHSPASEVFSFTGSMEVLYKDIPVTNSRCELVSLEVVKFINVFGQQTAVAYVMESTLRAKKGSAITYSGKEPEAALTSMLLNQLGQVTNYAEDLNAHLKAALESMDDREKFTNNRLDFRRKNFRGLAEVPEDALWKKMGLRNILIIGGLIIIALFVASYFGWLPRISWGR